MTTAPEPAEDRQPFTPDRVFDWLLDQPYHVSTHALIAALEALDKDDLFAWGPKPGTYADGEYERAHATFYALEAVLHDQMVTDGYTD